MYTCYLKLELVLSVVKITPEGDTAMRGRQGFTKKGDKNKKKMITKEMKKNKQGGGKRDMPCEKPSEKPVLRKAGPIRNLVCRTNDES